jgi:CheY-like chemotaxis protein
MPKSLLVADDSTTIRTAVGMIFKTEDVAVTAVADGQEALSRAKDLKPDLILADVNMPGLGGYELCERLRADGALRHIPVLLLGGGGLIDPSKAIAVGANGHLPKPFDSQKLVDHVRQILANPKARVQSAPPPQASKSPPAPASKPPPPPPARPAAAPAAAAPRPSVPPLRAPASVPPRPAAQPAAVTARPAAVAPASRPPAPRPAAPPSRPPPAPVRPAAPVSRPAPPVARQAPPPAPDDEIPLDEEVVDETPALRAVPGGAPKPSLAVVPAPARGDGGEALLREALSKASREVIEKIAWEVVPELAETIIREELERLIKERGQ